MLKRLLLIACGILIMLVTMTATSACTQKPETGYTEPEYAAAITDSILQAVNEGNYAQYAERFTEEMKQAATEAAFTEVNTVLKTTIGDYVAKEFRKTEAQGPYTTVYYKAKFTEEPEDVTVRVVFQEIDGEIYVAGLWFDSPKLRQSS